MADDDDPKTPPRSQADKDKSRQQSRPVSGRQVARQTTGGQPGRAKGTPAKSGAAGAKAGATGSAPKGGTAAKGGKGPGTKAPATKGTGKAQPASGATRSGQRPPRAGARPAAPAGRRSSATLLTWGAVVLVLVIVAALVIFHFAGSNNPGAVNTNFVPVSDTVAQNVTNIPTSVYNTVGITSSATPINPPTVIHGQPALTFDGKPGVFYFGAEYCPYCAAERWAIIASLSRFGKFTNLGAMESSTSDVFPGTQTFTFLKATFDSPYLALKTEEYESNQPSATGGYKILQNFSGDEEHLVTTYDSSTYFPADTSPGTFPFVDMGNKVLVSGASYSPSLLAGLSRDDIAAGLDDPSNPVTQAIVATSNYLSAGNCAIDGQKPASVCTSKGVTEAAKALHLSS